MKEYEIRPAALFDEYLSLCADDVKTFFLNVAVEEINCPACGQEGEHSFSKNSFSYDLCNSCNTLYVNPRPKAEYFADYYENGRSIKFWANEFYRQTADSRREKLWIPKAKALYEMLSQSGLPQHIVDIGGGYGLFAEEMQRVSKIPVTVIEPGSRLAKVCTDKGLSVIPEFLENVKKDQLPTGQKVFVSFELFEHLHSPAFFCETLFSLMEPGERFIFTTLSSGGLDIQVLWENSNAVSPPHHLNFFNPVSVEKFLTQKGFSNVEVTTPGKLDVDILLSNVHQTTDRFWNTAAKSLDDNAIEQLQKIFASANLSSHMLVYAEK